MQRPVLQKVLRGYDPIHVEALLDSVWPALDGTAAQRVEAKQLLSQPTFPVVMRGYDLRQVEAVIADLREELDQAPTRQQPVQGSDAAPSQRRPAVGGLGAGTTNQVAGTGDKAGAYRAIIVGVGLLGWMLRAGHWANIVNDLAAVAAVGFTCLGIYRLATRLTWSPEEICLVTGPWRRRIALRDLSEVSYATTRGMPNIVLRDTAGHKLVIGGLTARQPDWKPFILNAAHTVGARLTPGTEFLLNHPDHSG